VGNASGKVIGAVAKIYPKTTDFNAKSSGKAGKAAIIAYAEFAFEQMVVSEADAKPFVFAQQKFSAENQVPEEVIYSRSSLILCGLFLSEE
jgi:hypothetical protein